MLYFAGTDWFLLSWRLLPLPTLHMVESARSSSSAWVRACVCVFVCVCVWERAKHAHVYVRETVQHTHRETERGRDNNKRGRLKRNPKSVTPNMCVCVCVCVWERSVHLCVSALRQCVKMSRFDCRRFMSHKWWLTIHLPWTCTQTHEMHANIRTHTMTHTHTHTHTVPVPAFIHWPWRICAGSLTHAYLHWTHTLTHLLSGHSLKVIMCECVCVCVCVCVSVCPSIHVSARVKVTSSEADHLFMPRTDCGIDIENTWARADKQPLLTGQPASKL